MSPGAELVKSPEVMVTEYSAKASASVNDRLTISRVIPFWIRMSRGAFVVPVPPSLAMVPLTVQGPDRPGSATTVGPSACL